MSRHVQKIDKKLQVGITLTEYELIDNQMVKDNRSTMSDMARALILEALIARGIDPRKEMGK